MAPLRLFNFVFDRVGSPTPAGNGSKACLGDQRSAYGKGFLATLQFGHCVTPSLARSRPVLLEDTSATFDARTSTRLLFFQKTPRAKYERGSNDAGFWVLLFDEKFRIVYVTPETRRSWAGVHGRAPFARGHKLCASGGRNPILKVLIKRLDRSDAELLDHERVNHTQLGHLDAVTQKQRAATHRQFLSARFSGCLRSSLSGSKKCFELGACESAQANYAQEEF